MKNKIHKLQHSSWLIIGLLVGFFISASIGVFKIGVDNSVEVWFPEDDPALQYYQVFLNTFGNDESVVIGVSHPDGESMLNQKGLLLIEEATALAEEVEGIASVMSLSRINVLKGGNPIEAGPLWEGELSAEEVPEILEQIRSDQLLNGFVGQDEKMVLLLAQMEAIDNIDTARDGILESLRSSLKTLSNPVAYGGIGVVYSALNHASTQGAAFFIVGSYLLIALLLWILFRKVGPMLLTLGAVGGAATILMGIFGHLDQKINMVNMILPTIVLVIGVSSCVHMLVQVVEAKGETLEERARNGIAFVFWPCLLNTVTTCMGFLALGTATMPVVQGLGYFGALGLVISFILSVLICIVGATHIQGCIPSPVEYGFLQGMVNQLSRMATQYPHRVLSVGGVVALIALMGITRLEVDTYSIDFLRESHEVRVDSNHLEEKYGPYTPLEFVIRPLNIEENETVFFETLKDIELWQDELNGHPAVGYTRSMVDLPRRANQLLEKGGGFQLPEEPEALAQLLFLLSMDEDTQESLDKLYDVPSGMLRLSVGVPMTSAKQFDSLIKEFVALSHFRHAEVELLPSGYIPLYVTMMEYIVRSQLQSFGFAFLIIFAAVGILFRSLRMAVLSIPANLLPVLMTLGLMGLIGIRLDVATVTIAAIVLGLVVDDTIHFLYRYRHERIRASSELEAVKSTVRKVGRPMTITTIVLGLGFSVLGFAAVKSVAYFGLLLAFALLSALFSDLLIVPALIVLLGYSGQMNPALD